ncbi:MAG: ABC transporter permease [Defluviitaleaceae bacterium]|nr:ABC transporter permease [Defluviitaleaceae bacterium]
MKLKKFYLSLILFFLYAPICVLIIYSFNANRIGNTWGGFTFHWYTQLIGDRNIMRALQNTISIGLISAGISTIIGTLAAVSINNMKKNTRKIILSVSSLPVATPDIVIGVSLMVLYVSFFRLTGGGRFGFGTLLLSHIAFSVPYVILTVLPRFKHMNGYIYEAALDLGANPVQAFIKAVVPQLIPGIVTGFLLAFTMSIDDFIVSFFTTGGGVSNLSLIIFSMARRGVNPTINALSTIMFIAVMLLLFIINLRDTRKIKGDLT